MHRSNKGLSTVISGSYRKHLNIIVQLKQWLEEEGINVLSPSGDIAMNPDEDFVILDTDPIDHQIGRAHV